LIFKNDYFSDLARNFAVTVDAVAGATDQSKEAALTKLAKPSLTSQQVFESENDKGEI